MHPTLTRLLALALSLTACGGESGDGVAGPAPESDDTAALPAYVAEDRCADCHADAARAWTGSHHDLAMQEVSEETVLGDFDDAVFEHAGATTRFSRRDGRFVVTTPGPDGVPADYEVRYTFGVTPLQQYLLPLAGGRLGSFQVAWDSVEERWFHLQGSTPPPPGDPFHWTGPYQAWNEQCAECHSTEVHKGYDAVADVHETTFELIDVSCQACHGPAAEHQAWADEHAALADTDPDAAEAALDVAAPYGLLVDFAAGDSFHEVDQCARCHSRRRRVSPEDRPGRRFLDDFQPSLLEPGLYHADGQILDEVYVWGSFVQSRMYHQGVRCSDCHDPHALTLRVPGDTVCVQCHNDQRSDERFPTLRLAKYDTPEHHFHPRESQGARCVECHMPERTYMVVDPRRDHGLRVPRPDLAERLGVPEPCTGCHVDRTTAWAAETVAGWYPDSERRGPHFAEALTAGRRGDPHADSLLDDLARDEEQPALARATAVELLAARSALDLDRLATLAGDEQPLVRGAAAAALATLPPDQRLGPGAALLSDPLRSVRSQAARALHPLSPGDVDPALAARWRDEFEVYLATQESLLDMPAGRFNLGALAAAEGRRDEAERHYAGALELDPGFLPAAHNLTNLLNADGRNAEAVGVLRQALAEVPDDGELYYSLGLVLAELQQLEEAAAALGRAADLLPTEPRVAYNHAVALWQLGRLDAADDALDRAHALQPTDPAFLSALVQLSMQRGAPGEALGWAERLAVIEPGAEQLVAELRRQLDGG